MVIALRKLVRLEFLEARDLLEDSVTKIVIVQDLISVVELQFLLLHFTFPLNKLVSSVA